MLSAWALAAGPAAHVHVPDDLVGQAGGQVVVPVTIDNAEGIRGAEIRVNYDRDLLKANDDSVVAGSVWLEGNTQVVANIDDSAGTIVVFVFAAEGLDAGGGSLLEMHFQVRGNPSAGSSTSMDLAKVRLNEGSIGLDVEPVSGPDPTDGLITFAGPGGTATISGFVYADTNNNNAPDAHEGVPAVTVMLVGADGGQRKEAVTGDDGRYEFDGFAPGSYRIVEQQPAAFFDGGPNEILVDLAEGQDLAGQNFREGGLRPHYVYNRLLATVALPIGSAPWTTAVRQINDDAGSISLEAQSITIASNASTASMATAPKASPRAGTSASVEVAARTAFPDSAIVAMAVPSLSGDAKSERATSDRAVPPWWSGRS